ncbi:hypothetical protein RCL1_002218 [Eukaryota sp. TZLM3-RCL]
MHSPIRFYKYRRRTILHLLLLASASSVFLFVFWISSLSSVLPSVQSIPVNVQPLPSTPKSEALNHTTLVSKPQHDEESHKLLPDILEDTAYTSLFPNTKFFMIDANKDTLLSFWRYNIPITSLSSPFTVEATSNVTHVFLSNTSFLVRPHSVYRLLELIIPSLGSNTAFNKWTSDTWIYVTQSKFSSRHLSLPSSSFLPFPSCSWSLSIGGSGAPFISLNSASDLIYQIKNEKTKSLSPIHLLSNFHFKNLKPKYSPAKTAFVYAFVSDKPWCTLITMTKHTKAEYVTSIEATLKNTDRRVILLIHDVCVMDFYSLLSNIKNFKSVEVVPFSLTHEFSDKDIFGGKSKYRASFIVKSFYLMNINEYLASRDIDRFIYLDFDCFLQSNVDFLFDLDVPRDSLIGGLDTNPNIPFNGGVFVSSPNVFETKMETFIENFVQNFDSSVVNSVFKQDSHYLPHSEQELFFYFSRINNAYYLLPLEFNIFIRETRISLVHGSCSDIVFIVHTGGSKLSKLIEGDQKRKDTVELYAPRYFYFIENLRRA